ncbi:MAG: YitT family protein [Oscillospiraceae bacterium]|nr:YitT family protein [Oscillospiraceae bacterium]
MKKNRTKENKKIDAKKVRAFFADGLLLTVGASMYAAGVVCFVSPAKFVPGGLTTLAMIINHLVPFLPVGMMVFLLNVPLFITSWKVFGFKFIARTLYCSAFSSVVMDLINSLSVKYPFLLYSGNEKFLSAIFGGVVMGIGLGTVFLRGGTTGGTDILARLLRLKFPHLSVGKLVMISDLAVVMLAGIVYKSIETVLFSLVVIFLSSFAVDYVITGKNHSKMLMILTHHHNEVKNDIMKTLDRGVSILKAKGGYTGEDKEMLLCVVRAHEVADIRKIVAKYDENPFIIITDSNEVLGEGFKSHKDTL